jgi:hypothetical protein
LGGDCLVSPGEVIPEPLVLVFVGFASCSVDATKSRDGPQRNYPSVHFAPTRDSNMAECNAEYRKKLEKQQNQLEPDRPEDWMGGKSAPSFRKSPPKPVELPGASHVKDNPFLARDQKK